LAVHVGQDIVQNQATRWKRCWRAVLSQTPCAALRFGVSGEIGQLFTS
jgi:hypothetical protein